MLGVCSVLGGVERVRSAPLRHSLELLLSTARSKSPVDCSIGLPFPLAYTAVDSYRAIRVIAPADSSLDRSLFLPLCPLPTSRAYKHYVTGTYSSLHPLVCSAAPLGYHIALTGAPASPVQASENLAPAAVNPLNFLSCSPVVPNTLGRAYHLPVTLTYPVPRHQRLLILSLRQDSR